MRWSAKHSANPAPPAQERSVGGGAACSVGGWSQALVMTQVASLKTNTLPIWVLRMQTENPLLPTGSKKKRLHVCYSAGNNHFEWAGTYQEVTVIFKANSNKEPPEAMVTRCIHIPYLTVPLPLLGGRDAITPSVNEWLLLLEVRWPAQSHILRKTGTWAWLSWS